MDQVKGHEHRKKAKHNRNGRNRYEKGQHLYSDSPKHVVKRNVPSGRPLEKEHEKPLATLADVWPTT